MTYYGNDGKTYNLTYEIGHGGEGVFFNIENNSNQTAKIFLHKHTERDLRLELLANLPWSESARMYLALPVVALYEDYERRIFKDYIMDNIDYSCTLTDVCSEKHPLSIYKKSCVAENLCKAVIAVHSTRNIVIGDYNSNNILVDRITGKIRIVNVDSFHMTIEKAIKSLNFHA